MHTTPLTPPALSPEKIKEYSEQHPLFRRISGQVIWLLFEENQAASEDIDAFMDAVLKTREEQLAVMAMLLENPELFLHITLTNEGTACARCSSYNGGVLPASHPELTSWLAPFALGCRCRIEAISAEQVTMDMPNLEELAPPDFQLHCPSEWLFQHKWGQKTE